MKEAEEAAAELFKEKFPVEKYEEVQAHRRGRLETFKKHNVPAMIKIETNLIEWGEKVLALLKQHYNNGTKL